MYARDGVCLWGDSCKAGAHVYYNASLNSNAVRSWGRAPSGAVVQYTRTLDIFPLPAEYAAFIPRNCDSIRHCREAAVTALTKAAMKLPPLDQHATRASIVTRLSNLQFLEELFNTIDILQYQLGGVRINPHKTGHYINRSGDMFDIKAPGLAENRPSVLRGDRIHVRLQGSGQLYGGRVHFVNVDHVTVSLPFDFTRLWSASSRCDVIFTISRTQDRVRHEAIRNAPFASSAWCLTRASAGVAVRSVAVKHPRALNDKQREVLAMVTSGARASILWGPPGTGKTTALVAAIAETLVIDPHCRILVCAPSNEAADLIIDRLHSGYAHVCSSMLRLNGVSRDAKLVSAIVHKYSLLHGGGFEFPDVAELLVYRLVVCTLMTSGKLFAVGVPEQHFTHLFVDESGHTTEADLMVALQSAPNVKHMMLAGDHKQLGAVVRAPPCIEAGMHISPLQRLLTDPLMQGQVVMLTDNYRSHSAIVRIVNVMYNDKLIPAAPADPVLRHPTLMVEIIKDVTAELRVSNEFPVVFLHHHSAEDRENDSPSWLNHCEANMLVSIALDLHKRHGVPYSDIAIISPYRKQVKKIEGILHNKLFGYDAKGEAMPVHVSTVEMFQGRESRVVLLSCVRNRKLENVETDVKFSIGFLKQPLRANVALSRAKSLLVIAGNAGLMGVCSTWRRYLERIIALPSQCLWDVTKIPVQQLFSVPKLLDKRTEGPVALLDAITSAQEERPFERVA